MSVRERALRAWEEHKQKVEAEVRAEREAFLRRASAVAEERFGGRWEIDVEGRAIICEGIKLRPYCERRCGEDRWEFRLLDKCPKCGREIRSYAFTDLKGLGKALAGENWERHYCPVGEREKEEGECRGLLRLLADLLAPYLGCEECACDP